MKVFLLALLIHIAACYKNPCKPEMCDLDQDNLYQQLKLAGLHTVSDLNWVRESWFRGKGSAMYLTEAMSWKAMILGYSIFSGPFNSICQTACKPRGGNAYCEGRHSTTQWCTVPFHGQYGNPLGWFGKLYDKRAWGKIKASYQSWQWSIHHMCSSGTIKNVKQITTKRRPQTTICFLGNTDPMSMRDDGWYNPTAADQNDEKEWAKFRPYRSKLLMKWFNWAGYSDAEISRLMRERPMEPHPGMIEEEEEEGPAFQCFNDYHNNVTCRWRVPNNSSVTPGTPCTLTVTITKTSATSRSALMPPDSGHPHRRTVSVQFISKRGIMISTARIREAVFCNGRTIPEVEINEKGSTSAVKPPFPPRNLTVEWVKDGVNVSWVVVDLKTYFSKEFEVQYKNVHSDWEEAKSAVLTDYSFELKNEHMQFGQTYVGRVRVRYVRTDGENLWSDWSAEVRWIRIFVP